MTYQFLLLSGEDELFMREISIDAQSTFLHLHRAILQAVNYSNETLSSFFLCNKDWEQEQEITLFEKEIEGKEDLIMDTCIIKSLVIEKKQKLLYVFDYLADRSFFIELTEIKEEEILMAPICTKQQGESPKAFIINDDLLAPIDFESLIEKNENEDEDIFSQEHVSLEDAEGISEFEY